MVKRKKKRIKENDQKIRTEKLEKKFKRVNIT